MEKGRGLPNSSGVAGGSRSRNTFLLPSSEMFFPLHSGPSSLGCGKISFSTNFKPELIKRHFLRNKTERKKQDAWSTEVNDFLEES